jgi:ferredoxin
MMDHTCALLEGLGVPKGQIFSEAFVSPVQFESSGHHESASISDGTTTEDAGAMISHGATVVFARSQMTVQATPEMTLLEAAESSGVELPWECRSGICGQCMIKCLSGSVTMSNRDALSTTDAAADFVLACQAVPRFAEVALDA